MLTPGVVARLGSRLWTLEDEGNSNLVDFDTGLDAFIRNQLAECCPSEAESVGAGVSSDTAATLGEGLAAGLALRLLERVDFRPPRHMFL